MCGNTPPTFRPTCITTTQPHLTQRHLATTSHLYQGTADRVLAARRLLLILDLDHTLLNSTRFQEVPPASEHARSPVGLIVCSRLRNAAAAEIGRGGAALWGSCLSECEEAEQGWRATCVVSSCKHANLTLPVCADAAACLAPASLHPTLLLQASNACVHNWRCSQPMRQCCTACRTCACGLSCGRVCGSSWRQRSRGARCSAAGLGSAGV